MPASLVGPCNEFSDPATTAGTDASELGGPVQRVPVLYVFCAGPPLFASSLVIPALYMACTVQHRLVLDFGDEVNLDGGVQRERDVARGHARVPALVAKQRDQQVRAAVNDLRVLREARVAVDQAGHLDDPLDLVEVA